MKVKREIVEQRFSPDGRKHLQIVGDNVYAFRAPVEKGRYRFDREEAERWVRWCEECFVHIEGDLNGQRVELMPWQKAVIRELFGWVYVDTGLRRYNFAFIFVPRKNAKTQMMSFIATGLAAIDEEAKAQVYLGASTEEQAKLCFAMARDAIKASDFLPTIFEIQESYLRIENIDSESGSFRSYIQVLSGVPKGKTGLNVHGAVFDEFHEITDQQFLDMIKTGIVSRSQPLIAYITTAGKRKDSACHKEFLYAKRLEEGLEDNDNYMVFICMADEHDPPNTVATWAKANPGYGMSVNAETLRKLYVEAQRDPEKMDAFEQYHLNRWVNKSSGYLPLKEWESCRRDFSIEDLAGQVCYGGIDLGGKSSDDWLSDMSAFSLLFPKWEWVKDVDDDGEEVLTPVITEFKHLVWYFVTEKARELAAETNQPYDDWIDKGYIEVTPGNVPDYGLIRRRIKALVKKYKLKVMGIGYDDWHATEMCQSMQDADKFEMINVVQGFKQLNEPTKRYKDHVMAGTVHHNGNPVLEWNVKCARTVENKKKDRMIDKSESGGQDGKGKIDGLSSGLNAYRICMDAKPPRPRRTIRFIGSKCEEIDQDQEEDSSEE